MSRQRGATMVEAAMALSVLVLFIMGAMQISVYLMRQATLDHVVSVVHRRVAMNATPIKRQLTSIENELRAEAQKFGITLGPESTVKVCDISTSQFNPVTKVCESNNTVPSGEASLGLGTELAQILVEQPPFYGITGFFSVDHAE